MNAYTFQLSDEQLLGFTVTQIEEVGRTVVNGLKRRRAVLLCARDGHVYSVQMEPRTCERCAEMEVPEL
jgi:hypothetical protein